MKKSLIYPIVSLCLTFFFINTAFAVSDNPWLSITGGDDTSHKISLGVKSHFDYANFDDIPIKEDDYSYLMFYEIHNDFAYWQIGGSYTQPPDDNRFDHIITPQINLIAKDKIFRVGLGALASNVKVDGDTDWTDIYWQVILGLGIPLGERVGIDIYGHYLFDSWQRIEKPISEAPGISLMIHFAF